MPKSLLISALLLTILLPERILASHAMGSDISYECLGGNQYRVTVSFYRDCAGIAAPSSISLEYFSPSCSTPTHNATLTQSNVIEVSPICPSQIANSTCNGGPFPGVEQYTYSGIITLPTPCPDWIISYSECCRNNTITNLQDASNYDLFIYATINNSDSTICNNSPHFALLPVPYICAGVPFTYGHGAIDIDGDSLVYRLIPPSSDYLTPINYSGSFNSIYPLSAVSGTFVFDSLSGQMSFTPDVQQVAVITMLVEEHRNGVLVGTTMRDMQIIVLGSSLCGNSIPAASLVSNVSGGGLVDSNAVEICHNSTVSFTVHFTDPDSNNLTISSNIPSAFPTANLTVTGTGSNVTATFSWMPTLADAGTHYLVLTYQDDGCPVSYFLSKIIEIQVVDVVRVTPDTLVYCGIPVLLKGIGGNRFQWTPSAGLSNDTIFNPYASPLTPTMYYLNSDCGTDSVFVDVQPGFTLNAGTDTAICLNSTIQLSPQINPSGSYSYSWSPSIGLSDPNIKNPFASPPATTEYILKATSVQGCEREDSVNIGLNGMAPLAHVWVSKDTVCIGQNAQLNLTLAPAICGISTTGCITANSNFEIGTGSLVTGDGTPYKGFWHDARALYLFQASELNAVGINGGTITYLDFNISLKESTSPYSNFTIKMGCTSLNSLTGFVSGLDIVYGPLNYSTTAGWNHHVFSSAYDWDGTSNLLVEVCFDNSSYTQDDDVYYTTTHLLPLLLITLTEAQVAQ